jgi:protein-disulfide isomerase
MYLRARARARGCLGATIILMMAAIVPAWAGDSQVQPNQSRLGQVQLSQAQGRQVELPVEQIESIVRDYLLRNPEVIYQALQELQRRQTEATAENQRKAIASNQARIFDQPATPIGGNPNGDVTLVEFFDYHCAYCRRVVSSVQALVQEDKKLKIVFKEFPILGQDSVVAARAALAAERQGHYLPFHFALMHAPDLSLDSIMAAAKQVGLDTEQLARDMQAPEIQAQIEANYQLAQDLGIEGTPAFIIGGELIPGAVDKTRLVQLIDQARSACVSC